MVVGSTPALTPRAPRRAARTRPPPLPSCGARPPRGGRRRPASGAAPVGEQLGDRARERARLGDQQLAAVGDHQPLAGERRGHARRAGGERLEQLVLDPGPAGHRAPIDLGTSEPWHEVRDVRDHLHAVERAKLAHRRSWRAADQAQVGVGAPGADLRQHLGGQQPRRRLVGRRFQRAREEDPPRSRRHARVGGEALRVDAVADRRRPQRGVEPARLGRVLLGDEHGRREGPVGARGVPAHEALMEQQRAAPCAGGDIGLGAQVEMPRVERRDHGGQSGRHGRRPAQCGRHAGQRPARHMRDVERPALAQRAHRPAHRPGQPDGVDRLEPGERLGPVAAGVHGRRAQRDQLDAVGRRAVLIRPPVGEYTHLVVDREVACELADLEPQAVEGRQRRLGRADQDPHQARMITAKASGTPEGCRITERQWAPGSASNRQGQTRREAGTQSHGTHAVGRAAEGGIFRCAGPCWLFSWASP